jgi:hypothetical protein
MPTRYVVVAQPPGRPVEVAHVRELADAWRVAERLREAHGPECVSVLDLDAGIVLTLDERTSDPPR